MSRGRREREMLRITRENMDMFKRIQNKKPAISKSAQLKDWEKNLQFMDNISAFPEDWYLSKHLNRSASHGNLNTSRSSKKAANKSDDSAPSTTAPADNDYKEDFTE